MERNTGKITDEVNVQLMRALRRDSRQSLKELAAQVGKSTTAVHERIQKLESQGVIQGYHAQIAPWAEGKPLTVFVAIQLKAHYQDIIEGFMRDMRELDEVQEWFHVTGGYDYMLRVQMRDMADYQQFLTKKLAALPNIGTVQSMMVLEAGKVLP